MELAWENPMVDKVPNAVKPMTGGQEGEGNAIVLGLVFWAYTTVSQILEAWPIATSEVTFLFFADEEEDSAPPPSSPSPPHMDRPGQDCKSEGKKKKKRAGTNEMAKEQMRNGQNNPATANLN